MIIADRSQLDLDTLSQRLRALAGEERDVQASFLLHLDELDRRRGWAELGYPSLWEYCTRALHLREGAAARRIGAMKALRRFPRLEAALRDGRLCLSTLRQLDPVLSDENVDALTERAAFRSQAEVEAIVASLRPRPAPADGVRRVAVPTDPAPRETPPASPLLAARAPEHPEPGVAVPEAPLALAPPPSLPEVRAVATEQWSLRVTLDAEAKRDLQTLTDLLAHKVPGGDLAAVLKEALKCGIEKHGKRRGAVAPARPRAPSTSAPVTFSTPANEPASNRHVPAVVRREVWRRDQGRCTYVAPDGTRCGCTRKLELDHIVAAARGGPTTIANLRLRCRSHNLLHAEQTYGVEHMALFRRAPADPTPRPLLPLRK